MLGIDKGRQTAELLRLGNHLQRQCGLARRLRPEDLDDTAARHAADTERVIDADRARGDRVDRLDRALLSQPHDRALSKLLFDLADSQIDRLQLLAVLTVVTGRSVDAFHGRHAVALVRDGLNAVPYSRLLKAVPTSDS